MTTSSSTVFQFMDYHEDARFEKVLKKLKCISSRLDNDQLDNSDPCEITQKMLLELEVCENIVSLIKSDIFKLMFVNNKVGSSVLRDLNRGL